MSVELEIILAKLHGISGLISLLDFESEYADAYYAINDYLSITMDKLAEVLCKCEKEDLKPEEKSLVAAWRSADERAKESVANALRFTDFSYSPQPIDINNFKKNTRKVK